MSKFCDNGHQMEESWAICPYCQRTGYQVQGAGGGVGKTRIEAPSGSTTTERAEPRKTVLLSTAKRMPVVGWLVALDGPQRGEDFRLRDGQNFIGSEAGVEISLQGDAISARHASLRYRDGAYSLTDLDSTNGTFVNGNLIARDELKDNDVIRIGDVSLKFKCL